MDVCMYVCFFTLSMCKASRSCVETISKTPINTSQLLFLILEADFRIILAYCIMIMFLLAYKLITLNFIWHPCLVHEKNVKNKKKGNTPQ